MTDTQRRQPAQRRAEDRIFSIRDAANKLYDDPTVGRERMTTNDVAKEAGCSIGTVYRYYKDMVALLDDIRPDRNKADEILTAVRGVINEQASPSEKVAYIRKLVF